MSEEYAQIFDMIINLNMKKEGLEAALEKPEESKSIPSISQAANINVASAF
jgi:hypothetical protein